MSDLRVEAIRGPAVESVHRVSAVVSDARGCIIATAGDPSLVTYWRSAAKPFQALPLVEDRVLERFGLGSDALALACASHSSEPRHLEVTDRMLAAIGCTEADLACGPHPPLGHRRAREVAAQGIHLTPRWSNCSGKHAGMLALAKHRGWPTEGYEVAGHPVQDRILTAITRWTGVTRADLVLGVDGCTVVCHGLPVSAMVRAYASLASAPTDALRRVRDAMLEHPDLVAGEGRVCTDLMRAMPGQVIAKVGAEGIHCAALPAAGIGIALKVEDGDMRASGPALLEVLRALAPRLPAVARLPGDALRSTAVHPIRNTRGVRIGEVRAAGTLRFLDA
jgi:L-asparaginase II